MDVRAAAVGERLGIRRGVWIEVTGVLAAEVIIVNDVEVGWDCDDLSVPVDAVCRVGASSQPSILCLVLAIATSVAIFPLLLLLLLLPPLELGAINSFLFRRSLKSPARTSAGSERVFALVRLAAEGECRIAILALAGWWGSWFWFAVGKDVPEASEGWMVIMLVWLIIMMVVVVVTMIAVSLG